MIAKKKADVPSLIQDLRSEVVKKRLAAVCEIKEIALALGPAKARAQLIKFLEEFVDDQESIVMELLNQLGSFAPCLGGNEHEKCLLPLLILFCKTDERAIAYKSCQLIQRILSTNQDQIMETVKRICSTQMTIAKECGLQLMAKLLPKCEGLQKTAIEMMSAWVRSEKSQDKIVCAKYMSDIIKSIKSKEQFAKIFDFIFTDGDQLSKIYCVKALVEFYDFNPNFCLTKFKNIAILNSWRINLKICQIVDLIFSKFTKSHFKLVFEPMFLKFMISSEPQLRAASCQGIYFMGQAMNDEQHSSKLIPCLKKIAEDKVQYVKIQLSKNIVKLCEIASQQLSIESIFPIIFSFIKDQNSEISIGIIKSYDYLISKINKELFDQKIFKPLLQQLATDNWRVKCQIIGILKTFIYKEIHLSQGVLKVIFGLTDDKIDAVRLRVNELIVQIINKNSKEWVEKNVIPRIICGKQNMGYIKKQNFLDIIQKTSPNISEKMLKDSYQVTILACLTDKVANVKLKSLQVIKNSPKLCSLVPVKLLEKLKDDKDVQIRQLAKKLRA